MRALVLEAVEQFTVGEVEEPEVGPNDVLVGVTASGICGSELGGFLGTDGLRHPGLVFGHEFVGEVLAYGAAVPTGERLAVGTPVTANPMRRCGECRPCQVGRDNVCTRRELLGAHRHGSNAERVVVPAAAAYRLDHGSDPAAGVFAEPAACALRAVRQSGVGPGSSAVVIGAGPIGLLLIEVLTLFGVHPVWFTEGFDGRVAAAEASGGRRLPTAADELVAALQDATDGLGADAAFDAVGTAGTRATATRCVRPGGEVVFVGLHAAGAELGVRDLIRREVTCRTSFAYTDQDFAATLQLLLSGRLQFRGEVVRTDLADGQQWYERLIAGSPVAKVLLDPRTSAQIDSQMEVAHAG